MENLLSTNTVQIQSGFLDLALGTHGFSQMQPSKHCLWGQELIPDSTVYAATLGAFLMPKSTIFQYRWVYTDGLQWLTSHAAREAFPSGWVCPAERPRSGSTVAEPGGAHHPNTTTQVDNDKTSDGLRNCCLLFRGDNGMEFILYF